MLQGAYGDLRTLYMHLYVGQYPGSNYKEIKAEGAEETKSEPEEGQWFKEASLTCENPGLEHKLESITYFNKLFFLSKNTPAESKI